MAIVYTDDKNYQNIADAIRERNGSTDEYMPSQMAGAIQAFTGEEGVFKVVTVNHISADSTGNVDLSASPMTGPLNMDGNKVTNVGNPEDDQDATTKKFVSDLINETKSALINAIYPVGSIYIATDSTSPATLFGGTWEQIKDRFLLAAGNSYAAGSTGGAATHKLTANEIPSHQHSFQLNIQHSDGTETTGESMTTGLRVGGRTRYRGNTASVGGNAAHNNMPPYLTVYVWKRTA